MNSVEVAVLYIKGKIKINFDSMKEVPCTFIKNKREIDGLIIKKNYYYAVDPIDTLKPTVLIRSHTGKEYNVLLSALVSVNGDYDL